MKIIHVASYKDEFFSGIKSVLVYLVPAQRKLGHEVLVINHEYNAIPIIPGEKYVKYRKDFLHIVDEFQPDVVLFHSLYGINDVLFSRYLISKHIPYLVEPHGGTTKENAKKSWLKKKIAKILYVNSFISKAMGVVYLNQKEADECVFNRLRRSYAVIPNGTEIHGKFKDAGSNDGKIRFIFLARIDIIQKGLDLLFPAIKQFNTEGYKEKAEFHFYGKARNVKWATKFNKYLESVDDNVCYHGPVDGDAKIHAYQTADVFLLPSRYEGMPMSILEALSFGLPCMITPQTNMEDIIKKYHCGWVTSTTVTSITNTLKQITREYAGHSQEFQENSFKAVEQFSWEKISKHSISCYQQMMAIVSC